MSEQQKKRKCVFNDKLKKKYPFITKTTSNSDVRCQQCHSDFSISHGGDNDIAKHLGTGRHKDAIAGISSSKAVTDYFKPTLNSKQELEIAAAEGVWAYHTVQENQSFRSNDCTSKIIKTCFDPIFSCARTKCEAIAVNVFAPYAEKE